MVIFCFCLRFKHWHGLCIIVQAPSGIIAMKFIDEQGLFFSVEMWNDLDSNVYYWFITKY